jgi:hypothetical protein
VDKKEVEMLKRRVMLFTAVFFLIHLSSFAAINVANRTGTVKITMPDGTEFTVGPYEELPFIPDGSVIEIISGTADISATEDSYVEVVVGSATAYLGGGDAISVDYSAEAGEGNIERISGEVNVSYVGGTTTLDAGSPSFTTAIGEVETEVEVEEDTGDISPVS